MVGKGKFRERVSLLLVVVMLVQVFAGFGVAGFGGQVFAEATGITGQTGTSGAIYYDVSDASEITPGGGASGATAFGTPITSVDGLTLTGGSFREIDGWGTACLSVTINVATAGNYDVAFGTTSVLGAGLTGKVNAANAVALGAVEAGADNINWYPCGTYALTEGDNTVTLGRTAYGQVVGPLDVIRITASSAEVPVPALQPHYDEDGKIYYKGKADGSIVNVTADNAIVTGPAATNKITRFPDGTATDGEWSYRAATTDTFKISLDVEEAGEYKVELLQCFAFRKATVQVNEEEAVEIDNWDGANYKTNDMTAWAEDDANRTLIGTFELTEGINTITVTGSESDTEASGKEWLNLDTICLTAVAAASPEASVEPSVAPSEAPVVTALQPHNDADGKIYYKGKGDGSIVNVTQDNATVTGPAATNKITRFPDGTATDGEWSYRASSTDTFKMSFNVEEAGTYKVELLQCFAFRTATVQVNNETAVEITNNDGANYKTNDMTAWAEDDANRTLIGTFELTEGVNTITVTDDNDYLNLDTICLTAVAPSVTALQPHNDADGKIYYKGKGDGSIVNVTQDNATVTGPAATNFIARFPDGTSIENPWSYRSSSTDTFKMSFNVEEAGTYKVELLQCFAFRTATVQVNNETAVEITNNDGANYKTNDMTAWAEDDANRTLIGTYELTEGINTITVTDDNDYLNLDTICLTAVTAASPAPSVEPSTEPSVEPSVAPSTEPSQAPLVLEGVRGTSGAIYYDPEAASQFTASNDKMDPLNSAIASADGVTFNNVAFREGAGAWGSWFTTVKINVDFEGEYDLAFGVATGVVMPTTLKVSVNGGDPVSILAGQEIDGAIWHSAGSVTLNQGINTIKVSRPGYNNLVPIDVIKIKETVPVQALLPHKEDDGNIYYKGKGDGSIVNVTADNAPVTGPAAANKITRFPDGTATDGDWSYRAETSDTFKISFRVQEADEYKVELLQCFAFRTATVQVNSETPVEITNNNGENFKTNDMTAWAEDDANRTLIGEYNLIKGVNTITVTGSGDYLALDTICIKSTYVEPTATAIQPHIDADGVQYYKGNQNGVLRIENGRKSFAEGTSGYPGIIAFPDGTATGGNWGVRVNENVGFEFSIDVPEEGWYILSFGQRFGFNTHDVSVNGSENVSKEGWGDNWAPEDSSTWNPDQQAKNWSTFGVVHMNEGVNTVTVTRNTNYLSLDTIRLVETTEPSPTPSPTPTPSPSPAPEGSYDFNHVQHMTIYIPEDQQGSELGGSPTGGHQHTYCSAPGQVATFTLSGIDAGIYELYYLVPLVHTSNANAWVVEAEDSFGNYSKNTINAWTSANQPDVKNNVSPTGVRSGEWVKLDGQFTFYQGCDGTVIVTQGPNTVGHNRYCRVRLVKVGDVSGKPLATDVVVTGSNKLGGTLFASYNYVDANDVAEADSEYKWYAKASENDVWVEVASGTTTAAEGSTYTLQNDEAFAKFEIVPKSENVDPDLATGVAASAEFEVTLDDVLPVAKNVAITGVPYLGAELIGTYEYEDGNDDLEADSKYRWLASNDLNADFSEWTVLEEGTCDATTPLTYTIPVNMLGSYIALEITPVNDGAAMNEGIVRYSVPVGPIVNEDIVPTVEDLQYAGQVVNAEGLEGLAIDGIAEVDYTYNYLLGTAEGASTIQWYRADAQIGPWTAIDGATGTTYTPTNADSGKYIRYGVTPVAGDDKVGEETFAPARIVKWKLGFHDEFDYTAVDGRDANFAAKWNPEAGLCALPDSYTARIPENISVNNGTAKIVTKVETHPNYVFPHEFTSGSFWAKETVGPFGYYETRMKYAPASGLNQSFWTRGADNREVSGENAETRFVELDFCEGHYPNMIRSNLHGYNATTGLKYAGGYVYYPYGSTGTENMSEVFTVIGGYLKPNDSRYDFDAVENQDVYRTFANGNLLRSSYATSYVPAPQQIFCSIAPYRGWAGEILLDMVDGATAEYDYVRYYEEIGVSANDNTFTVDYTIINTQLASAKAEAADLIANATIGTDAGNYSEAAKSDLEDALAAANAVTNDVEKMDAVNALNDAIDAFKDSQIGDRSELQRAIVLAENALNSTSAGNEDGQCPAAYYNTLRALVNSSKALVNSDAPTQAALDNQLATLQRATDNLIANIINEGEEVIPSPSPSDPGVSPSPGVPGTSPSPNVPSPSPDPIAPVPPFYGPAGGGGFVPGVTEPEEEKDTFADVVGHWAQKEIDALTKDGVINGRTATEFDPEGTMTRAEFAALIRRALGLSTTGYQDIFTDVNGTEWYAKEIQAVVNAGIMNGDGAGTFRPNDLISRQEMAKVLVNAYRAMTGVTYIEGAELTFTDNDQIAGWAVEYVQQAVALGLVNGMGDGSFAPEANMTRAQGAVAVYRLVK